jgi:hypothetical protein
VLWISVRVIPIIPASTSCELSTDLRKLSSAVHNAVDKFRGELDERLRWTLGPRYFHCVETPKPAAMKPKPTTMFQFWIDSIGIEPSVT